MSTNRPVAGTIGSSDSTHSTWSALPAAGRGPNPIQIVCAPHAGARRMVSRTCASSAEATAMITSPGLVATRAWATGSGSTSATAGRARLPMITGCTNSTATWWAWGSHCGEMTHKVAPA